MRKYLLPLMLVALTTIIFSCKKKELHYSVSGQLKQAFSYKPGSYWVMTDSLSGQTDSFYVTGITDKNVPSISTPTYTYEDVIVSINEVNELPAGGDTTNWTLSLVQNGLTIGIFHNYTAITYDAIPYPFVNASYSGLYDTHVSLPGNYAEKGNSFTGVALLAVSGGLNDSLYMNAAAGFIRLTLNHGSSYRKDLQLVRWKIVR